MSKSYIYNKDSFENSVEVENYPWGFRLKTKKRYWIETNKRGSRLVLLYSKSKNNQWCKAKAFTYSQVGVLTSEIKDGKNFISGQVFQSTQVIKILLNSLDQLMFNNYQKKHKKDLFS